MRLTQTIIISCFAAPFLLVVLIGAAQAQPPGRTIGGGLGPSAPIDQLLNDRDLQAEIGLVDDQLKELQARNAKFRERLQELFRGGFRDLAPEEQRERFEQLREVMAEAQLEIENILLPHQRDRLRQIQLQEQLRRSGTAGGLTNNEVAEALGITKEQQEALRVAEREAQEELNEKIERAREEARNKILSVLTPVQREKLEKLLGRPFERNPQRPFGFRDNNANDEGGPRGEFRSPRPGAD